MSDPKNKNGEGGDHTFDLSRPLQGEPTREASDDERDDAGRERRTGDDPGQGGSGDDAGEAAAEESPPEATAAGPEATLPLSILHELEQEPPVREQTAPPEKDEDAGAPVAGEESCRRLSEAWRIDLKWIFGIPATAILLLTIAAFVLFRVSGEEVATGIIEETREEVVSSESFREELAELDPSMLELLESEELALMLYEDPELLQSLLDEIPEPEPDDPLAEQYEYATTTLGIYNALAGSVGENEHIQTRSALIALLLMLALFGIPYIIFSRRVGKIVSVAVSLAIASWIPLLLLMLLRGGMSDWIAERADVESDSSRQLIVNMVDEFAREFVEAAMPVYRFFSILALILMGFGLLGLLFVWWRFEENIVPRKKKFRGTGE